MASLVALMFDVDGTLADTERHGHRVAFNRAFSEAGLDWEWSEATYGELLAVAGGKERIRFYLERFNKAFRCDGDLDQLISDLHAAKTRHYISALTEGAVPLRIGVRRLLHEARSIGLRLAIATTTSPANVCALLANSLGDESPAWFDVIAAGDIVAAKKPAPDIYRYAMNELNLEPRHCMVLEDSENGVRSALGADLNSLLVTTNGYTRDHDFGGAAAVLDHLGDRDQPCRVSAGPEWLAPMVTVERLRRLHDRVYG